MTLPRWIGPGAVAFLGIWLVLLVGGRSNFLRDPGTFWHVTTGELILSDGFIRADPYTFTFAGTWWVPYQWLGEVAMALAHRAGGFDALLLGAITIIAAVFAGLAVRLLRTGLNPILVGALVFSAIAASSSHFHVRPHLFTIAGMAITAAILVDIDTGRAPLRRLAWLVPLFVVWTNVHGGVLGGMASVALVAGGWVVARGVGMPSPVQGGRDAVWVLGIAVTCGLTALANPYGLDLIRTWQVIMGEPALKLIIQEHRPLDPAESYAWPVFGLAAVYLFLLVGVPLRQLRVSWLLPLVWLVLSLDRVRHAPLFAVVTLAAMASVWPYTRWADWFGRNRPDFYDPTQPEVSRPVWAHLWLPGVAVLVTFSMQVARVEVPVIGYGWARHDPHQWPVELLDVLKEYEPRSAVGNHLFNDYIDGGFVIYHAPGYKVFVDDRCEVFGGEWLVNFVRAGMENTAAAVAGWEAQHGRFDFALTRTATGFEEYFAKSDDWVCVKRTETAAFYKRK